jgi:hypothetical protein
MPNCFKCGGKTHRIHRTFLERLRYAAVYRCRDCGEKRLEDQWYLFLLGRVSRCPHCGTHRLRKLRRIDKIDRMYPNPLSLLQKYFGANLHWCQYCRLQFYDFRPRVEGADQLIRPGGFAEESAVHPDGLTGDKVSTVAGEEDDRARDVERHTDTAQGS